MSGIFANKSNYILAVDDIPDNLFLIELALEQEGHQVVSASDGRTALAHIEKSPPALVVLDVMMPRMDGYEVTRRIRQNPALPFIPILLITAHEHSDVVRGLDVGADEFIRKPVKVDELQARVRSLLRLKQSIDQRENFVSCLTHDLRTPLVAADRMLSLIRQGRFGQVNGEIESALGTVISSNQNLLEMLNTLLEVYCYDIGQKVLSFIRFNLPELVQEILQELSPLALEKGIELRLHSQLPAEELVADRLELRRVLTNLVGNAIKFTEVGYIEVSLALVDAPQSFSEPWLEIAIADTGAGIAPEDQQWLFEQFRKGKHKRSGSGLGLYLCRQIVQSHHGEIQVSSQLGQGTTFTILLPQNPTTVPKLLS
ncbi:MAG: response regulator [Chloroflexaceae bacterium]|nr:response regulator [Chloroflexaceae bacterium]